MAKSDPTRPPGVRGKRFHGVIWFLQILVLYAVIAAVFATERTMAYLGQPDAPSWPYAYSLSIAPWAAWLILTPLVVYLTRAYPLEGAKLKRSLLVHAGAALALAPLQAYLNTYIGVAISVVFEGYQTTWKALLSLPQSFIIGRSVRAPLIYAVIVGITSTVDYYRKFRDRELKAAQLEGQLATARLSALQSQIRPHFLFNALNAVTTLMRQDPRAAEKMLVRLADLLRLTLDGGESQEVPLQKELDLLDAYLGIERVRFSDRLMVVREIDAKVLEAPVPRLLLQPLAENAIRHGLAPKRGEGTLWIRARPVGDALELALSDDGVGLRKAGFSEGVGLGNTRARLKTLYGESGVLEVGEREGGGVAAVVRVPLGRAKRGGPGIHPGQAS